MTLSEVKDLVGRRGTAKIYRGTEYTVDFLPKTKFEIVIADDRAQRAVERFWAQQKTGKNRRRQDLCTEVEEVVRIRTVNGGMEAL